MRLVLASASPRRADLLRAAGFEFVIRAANVDESILPGEDPESHVRRLAIAKTGAVEVNPDREIVLAADTVVVIDGEILGKPRDEPDAARILRRLSGREHSVVTGIAAKKETDVRVAVEQTRVWFEALTDSEIDWYVASGEPRGKAGAYAIQGRASRFVSRIEGSYANVVGLPIHGVWRLLREFDRDRRG